MALKILIIIGVTGESHDEILHNHDQCVENTVRRQVQGVVLSLLHVFVLPFFFFHPFSGKDSRFPLPLRRCLLGFREGMELFKFGLSHLTGVLRQKGYVYDLGGHSTGTVLEVCVSFLF